MFVLHDMIEANGKTIKENNLAKSHNIPVGTLVEVKFNQWFGGGACWKVQARFFVVYHNWDCDGTPLYSLSRWKEASRGNWINGFSEKSLTVVPITPELLDGVDALEWWERERGNPW